MTMKQSAIRSPDSLTGAPRLRYTGLIIRSAVLHHNPTSGGIMSDYQLSIYECNDYHSDLRDGCYGEAAARMADEFDSELTTILTGADYVTA